MLDRAVTILLDHRRVRRLTVGLLALGALILLPARTADAQGNPGSRIQGTVLDSVHLSRLAGIRVLAVGVESHANIQGAATTDSLGYYHIDSLPVGRYSVGFESPLLDSLEVTVSPREAAVTQAGTTTVDLALPPPAKLLAAVCPGVTLPSGTGAIVGHVVSAETDGSLPGVTIAMSWHELSFDKAALRPVNGERIASVVTDDAGWYRVCGVPTGAWLSMQLQHEGRIGPVIRTFVGDTLGLAVRHLSFSAISSRAAKDTLTGEHNGNDGQLLSGTASLTGTVLGPEGLPISQAELRVIGTSASGRSDAQGRYSLTALPAGTQMLMARRVGYAVAETYVDLREGATKNADLRLKRIVSLDSMRVVATRERYPQFSMNRKSAVFGLFLGPDEIQRQRVSFASDIIEKLPGFRIEGIGIQSKVVSGRGPVSFTGGCPMSIALDGVRIEGMSINDIPVSQIGAIEAYRAGDFGPPTVDKGCGAIVIWTKR